MFYFGVQGYISCIKICINYLVFDCFFVQTAEIAISVQMLFLTGTEASGLTVTLLHVEKEVRGVRI